MLRFPVTREDPAAAATREVEEETGWRRGSVEFVLSCQPLIGNADYPQDLYLAAGAELTGEPEADETAEVRWEPLLVQRVMGNPVVLARLADHPPADAGLVELCRYAGRSPAGLPRSPW
jgi:8-oxo-dGTP pyrophosphatase MutT (NUDIX family)